MTAVLTLDTPTGKFQQPLAGAIFDCDGLLFDSESVWLTMLSDWQKTHGLHTAELDKLTGVDSGAAAQLLADRLASEQHVRAQDRSAAGIRALTDEITAEIDAEYSRRLAADVPTMPGAEELLRSLSAIVPIAIASNGTRKDVLSMLTSAGLDAYAQQICTIDDVSQGKPAPEIYLTAAESLGISPRDCASFEDSSVGSQAARSAETTVIGVNPDPTVHLDCHHRLSALTQVSVEKLP